MAFSDAQAVASEPRMLRSLCDEDLLVLISFGDLDALGVVYDRHVEATWRVALHFSDDLAAAEEAVAAVFVRLWREAEVSAQTSLTSWLRSSVAREARGLQQREGEERMTDSDTPRERAIMAAVNGVIDDLHGSLGIEETEFFCECGDSRCRERIRFTRSQYANLRKEGRKLVLEAHANRVAEPRADSQEPGFSQRVQQPLRGLGQAADSL